jgi:hypothetical protein
MHPSKLSPVQAPALLKSPWICFIIVALLVGLSFFSRHIAGYVFAGGNYNPLVYNPTAIRNVPPPKYAFLPDDGLWDETRAYARWTQEIRRGEFAGAAPRTYAVFFQGPIVAGPVWVRDRLGPFLLAAMAGLCGGVPRAFALADFIFPFTAAFVLFWLAWTIRPSLPFALSTGVLICIFDWADLRRFAEGFSGTRDLSSSLLRTPYPQLSLGIFAAFLVVLLVTLKSPTWRNSLLLGFLLIVNFYTYFYSWTFACCWIIVSCIQIGVEYFRHRERVQTAKLRALLFASAVALVLSFPIWRSAVFQSQAAIDSFFRLNGELTHRPALAYTALFSAALVAVSMMRPSRGRGFAICYLGASLLVLNQQVLTGKTLQPGHWTAYFIQPLVWLVLLDCAWELGKLVPVSLPRRAAVALVCLALTFNTAKLTIQAETSKDYNLADSGLSELVARLDAPEFRPCGYLSNDPYLTEVLPGYVKLKQITPWYMDPLSNDNLVQFRQAIAVEFSWSADSSSIGKQSSGGRLRLRPEKVILVLNRHRPLPDSSFAARKSALKNNDFEILVPETGCPSK